MELPVLLPDRFSWLKVAEGDAALFSRLKEDPAELIAFFTFASRDGPWAEEHRLFLTETLEWATRLFFEGKLSDALAEQCYLLVHENERILGTLAPKDLQVQVGESIVEVNSLLFAMSSDFLNQLLRSHHGERRIKLEEGKESLPYAAEYIASGKVEHLWRCEARVLLSILRDVDRWGITGMTGLCCELLARYINKVNVIDYLLLSHRRQWEGLRRSCCDFIEELELGVAFPRAAIEEFAVRFSAFKEEGLDLFERIKGIVTRLAFEEELPQEPPFSHLVSCCPLLEAVDLSGTRGFSDRFRELPTDLRELDLSMCGWLGDEELQFFTVQCPEVEWVKLSSNSQLTYKSWGRLASWKRLEKLDLARCHQLSDEDLSLICRGSSELTMLNLEECNALTDRGIEEIAQTLRGLELLNLARCKLTDIGLVSLADRCRNLRMLVLTRCPNISDKGIREAASLAKQLRTLDVAQTEISDAIAAEVRRNFPYLELLL